MQLVDCGILWFGRLVYDSSRFVDSNKSISRPKLESLPVLRRQIATASKSRGGSRILEKGGLLINIHEAGEGSGAEPQPPTLFAHNPT